MKKRIKYVALLIALPGVVWAGSAHFSKTKIVIDESPTLHWSLGAHEYNPVNVDRKVNYDLVWNKDANTFDVTPGYRGRPVPLEDSFPLQTPVPTYHYNLKGLEI